MHWTFVGDEPASCPASLRRALQARALISVDWDVAASATNSVVVKDSIDVEGAWTTNGAPRDAARRATSDATAVKLLRRSGYEVVGKANLEPWAIGATGANPWWGMPENPAGRGLVPGGSSSGSAVATAVGVCKWAIGTDTGGSVRIPAAFCGIVGFKPTQERIPTGGCLALSPSLDTVGVLARTLDGIAEALGALEIPLATDQNPASPPIRLARPEESWLGALDPSVEAAWRRLRPEAHPVSLPDLRELRQVAFRILAFESANVHARLTSTDPAWYPSAAMELLEFGRTVSSMVYEESLREGESLRKAVASTLHGFDALILPTVQQPPPSITAPVAASRLTKFTLPFNLTRQPAITIPIVGADVPIGLQLVAAEGRDEALIKVARVVMARWLAQLRAS